MNGSLYFHFTNYGKKMRLLEKEKRVCVEIEKYRPDLSEYSFVTLRGRLTIVKDTQERNAVIERMVKEGKKGSRKNSLLHTASNRRKVGPH
jgi:nitroimidazol reductase NimA-like FMN-containing flavoprotein (pyridoxamine 5'-phosphate oxidase superfamily)